MRAVDIIVKKRDHQELTRQEIEFFVQGYTRGEIPDYQASAWAMAVLLNGMTPRETTDLTLAMAHSGDMLDRHAIPHTAVDHDPGTVTTQRKAGRNVYFGDATNSAFLRACGVMEALNPFAANSFRSNFPLSKDSNAFSGFKS
mgnify:CR=1 FL=1